MEKKFRKQKRRGKSLLLPQPNSSALLLFEGANKVVHTQCTDNV
jgi:hypothetical protein